MPDEIIGLRFSNVMEAAGLCAVPAFDADARLRKWNLWAYIDARDAAQAIRKAIEAPIKGAEIFIMRGPGWVPSRIASTRSGARNASCSDRGAVSAESTPWAPARRPSGRREPGDEGLGGGELGRVVVGVGEVGGGAQERPRPR